MGMRAIAKEEDLERKTVMATRENKYWAICDNCKVHFRIFMTAAEKARYCPNCGVRIKYEGNHDAGAGPG